MTGTAFTEAEEFQQIYSLDVIQIPSNRPLARIDHQDLIFKGEKGKLKAVADAIKEYHKQGRPVLVGSASIAKNELIADWLDKEKVPYEILNAKNNEREAAIVAKAGEKGAITLATNIAGRGTDIVLGKGVKELGGLVVIGSERHESRRIDNQLRGRGGRQGDPGETQFYVSTEDDLMRIFQGERIASLMDTLGGEEDQPIQNKAVSRTLEAAQKRVEGYNFDTRKNVVQYDNVMNRHRKAVYSMRRQILEQGDISSEVKELVEEEARQLAMFAPDDKAAFQEQLAAVIPLKKQTLEKLAAETKDKDRFDAALKATTRLYKEREKDFGPDIVRKLEREIYLQVLDTLWMQHLENMQHLRDGIHWRSVGQRDPLVEYRQESQRLFEQLQATLREEVVRAIFHVTRQDVAPQNQEEFDTDLTRAAERSVEQGVNEIADMEHTANFDKKNENVAKKKKAESKKKRKQQRQNRKKHK